MNHKQIILAGDYYRSVNLSNGIFVYVFWNKCKFDDDESVLLAPCCPAPIKSQGISCKDVGQLKVNQGTLDKTSDWDNC